VLVGEDEGESERGRTDVAGDVEADGDLVVEVFWDDGVHDVD
jgi:hypothetical protein